MALSRAIIKILTMKRMRILYRRINPTYCIAKTQNTAEMNRMVKMMQALRREK